jgi:hypothetical protein
VRDRRLCLTVEIGPDGQLGCSHTGTQRTVLAVFGVLTSVIDDISGCPMGPVYVRTLTRERGVLAHLGHVLGSSLGVLFGVVGELHL